MSEVNEMKSLTLNGTKYDSFPDQTARAAAAAKLPGPASAVVGQYLVVEEVDADGKITKVKTVEAPSGGSDSSQNGDYVKTVNGVEPDENGNVDTSAPTDEQVSTAVSAWLDEHPEATTTVEDGSITEEKLHPDLVDTLKKAKVNDELYDTQAVGTLFDRPDGWNYVTWCSNALQYDPKINKFVNLAWARGGHTDESNADSQDTIYRVLIDADTLLVDDISPIVMLDSDGVTDITSELMEGASFMILKDGTYVYQSYLDDTSTYAAYRYTSTDYGKTWAKDANASSIKFPYKARELSNGRILFSTTEKGGGIWISDDGLRSAKRATVAGGHGLAYGSYVSEWEFVELEENHIMAIGRKNQGGAGADFSGDSDHALITYSTDNGTTWSQIVESQTIDNMNASNATSIVHDGLVEIFTTSRWYHNHNNSGNTNSDYDATGKDGAMFHYVATIEDAKNDNFTNLGVVLYANGTNDSAQDFHAPCLAYNSRNKSFLLVYMDRMESLPDEENNNYHYVRGHLGDMPIKVDDKVKSSVRVYSNKKIDDLFSSKDEHVQSLLIKLKAELIAKINDAILNNKPIEPEPDDDPTNAYIYVMSDIVYNFNFLNAEKYDAENITLTDEVNGIVGSFTTAWNQETEKASAIPTVRDNSASLCFLNVPSGVAAEYFPSNIADYTVEYCWYLDDEDALPWGAYNIYNHRGNGGGGHQYTTNGIAGARYLDSSSTLQTLKASITYPSGINSNAKNVLHHIAFVFHNDGASEIYYNGELNVSSDAIDGFNGWVNNAIADENRSSFFKGTHNINGFTRSCRMYAKALTAEEVANNYYYELNRVV